MRISYWSSDVCSSDLIDEGGAREIGQPHHVGDGLLALVVPGIAFGLGQHDADFLVVGQVIQRHHDVPAVHLALVDLLGAVIEPGSRSEERRVGKEDVVTFKSRWSPFHSKKKKT